ncbi:hypothetical protein FISHEDRAFT_64428 [Fistulina hepatica ATCC 64428]|nr:hypothetical protein FISHEDRAFT_64428 [Fistulina hepatica ATCC 64428]
MVDETVIDEAIPEPSVEDGINFWNSNGVLGGFGAGSLPRIESLGSRQFLMKLLPELCIVPSALRPLDMQTARPRTRALDVGAGVGRVTSDVLLHLFSDVVLLEPVEHFVKEALSRGQRKNKWRGIVDETKSVTFYQGTLQSFDPSATAVSPGVKLLGRVGRLAAGDSPEEGFDVVWCQWCLGHLSDPDLVAFLIRSKKSLRDRRSLIVVKENICSDAPDGTPRTVFDEQDSSLTRSDIAWKTLFEFAGLALIKQEVQHGLPEGLYVVKM